MELLNRGGLVLGIGSGFQTLLKTGLLPFGGIRGISPDTPALATALAVNAVGRFVSDAVTVKTISNLSPWLWTVKPGHTRTLPAAGMEGRFYADENSMTRLIANHQIAAQYVDFEGNPSNDIRFNPFGSLRAVESISSPDGRVLGKMGRPDQMIFDAGVNYFK